MLEHFVGDAELLEGVNSAGRKREINRAASDEVPLAWIRPALIKINFRASPTQVSREHSTRETAPNEDEVRRHGGRIDESGKQEGKQENNDTGVWRVLDRIHADMDSRAPASRRAMTELRRSARNSYPQADNETVRVERWRET